MRKSNPFTPGTGLVPPYLAGREKQQKLFKGMLDDLAAGKPANITVMFGPRGMGKTVLLTWLENQCVERKIRLIRGDSSSMLGSVDVLTRKLLARKWWFNERGGSFGTKWLNIGVSAPAQGSGGETFLAERLIARCRKKPMVVLLDEAHVSSNSEALRLLLNTAQRVVQKAPFMLVLAGTPGLTETLNNAESTFVERAESVGLECLNEEAAAKALSIPLEKDGITMAEDALNQVVEDSQRYPFFIQQWGKALWDHAVEKGASMLTQDDVALVMNHIHAERDGFYRKRYSTIREAPNLLVAAEALAETLLTDRKTIGEDSALSVIKNNLSASLPRATDIEIQAVHAMNGLVRHDFIWCPPASDLLVPGIPSFLTYIHNRAQARQE